MRVFVARSEQYNCVLCLVTDKHMCQTMMIPSFSTFAVPSREVRLRLGRAQREDTIIGCLLSKRKSTPVAYGCHSALPISSNITPYLPPSRTANLVYGPIHPPSLPTSRSRSRSVGRPGSRTSRIRVESNAMPDVISILPLSSSRRSSGARAHDTMDIPARNRPSGFGMPGRRHTYLHARRRISPKLQVCLSIPGTPWLPVSSHSPETSMRRATQAS
jgi:hypothetical protein